MQRCYTPLVELAKMRGDVEYYHHLRRQLPPGRCQLYALRRDPQCQLVGLLLSKNHPSHRQRSGPCDEGSPCSTSSVDEEVGNHGRITVCRKDRFRQAINFEP